VRRERDDDRKERYSESGVNVVECDRLVGHGVEQRVHHVWIDLGHGPRGHVDRRTRQITTIS